VSADFDFFIEKMTFTGSIPHFIAISFEHFRTHCKYFKKSARPAWKSAHLFVYLFNIKIATAFSAFNAGRWPNSQSTIRGKIRWQLTES